MFKKKNWENRTWNCVGWAYDTPILSSLTLLHFTSDRNLLAYTGLPIITQNNFFAYRVNTYTTSLPVQLSWDPWFTMTTNWDTDSLEIKNYISYYLEVIFHILYLYIVRMYSLRLILWFLKKFNWLTLCKLLCQVDVVSDSSCFPAPARWENTLWSCSYSDIVVVRWSGQVWSWVRREKKSK